MKIRWIAGLLTALSSVAIVLAPLAPAVPLTTAPQAGPDQQQCQTTSAATVCTSPGNAQINDAPPFVQNFPMYGNMPWILGH